MDEITPPGEFHHFQLFHPSGEVPMSISILVHTNQIEESSEPLPALTGDDLLALHFELEQTQGNLKKVFAKARKARA